MSDLQCAATLLLTCPGEDAQSRALGRSLRKARLASIYASGSARAARAARLVAAETGVPLVLRDGLRDCSADELESIADLHRGETVLVVSETVALQGERLTVLRDLVAGTVVEVAVDADGWTLLGDVRRN